MASTLRRRLRVSLIFQLASQLIAFSVLGSEGSSAQALFETGRSAMLRGDYGQACLKFEESQRLDPAAGTLLNLANCEAKLGHLTRAWLLWKAAEDELAAGDERIPFVRGQIQALENRLPRVIYRIANPPGDLEVEADGVSLLSGSLGAPLPVDPGEHQVKVRATGYAPWSVRYVIAEREQKTIQLQLGPRSSSESLRRSTQETAGLWLLGIGAGGLLVSGTTGVLAANSKATYDRHCADSVCDARGDSAAKSGKALVLVNIVSWVATLASATAGGLLVLTAPRDTDSRPAAWQLVPTQAGIGVQRAF